MSRKKESSKLDTLDTQKLLYDMVISALSTDSFSQKYALILVDLISQMSSNTFQITPDIKEYLTEVSKYKNKNAEIPITQLDMHQAGDDIPIYLQGKDIWKCNFSVVYSDGTVVCSYPEYHHCISHCEYCNHRGKLINVERYKRSLRFQMPFGIYKGVTIEDLLKDKVGVNYLYALCHCSLTGQLKNVLKFLVFEIINLRDLYNK